MKYLFIALFLSLELVVSNSISWYTDNGHTISAILSLISLFSMAMAIGIIFGEWVNYKRLIDEIKNEDINSF